MINWEINLILTWSADCVISSASGGAKFAVTDTKLYVLTVALSIQDNAKLLHSLILGLKRITNWNKYQLQSRLFY